MKLFCRTCYEAFYEGALREQRLESAANMQLLKNYENKERALHIFLKRYPNNLILDFLHYDDYFEVMSVEFLSHAKQVSNGEYLSDVTIYIHHCNMNRISCVGQLQASFNFSARTAYIYEAWTGVTNKGYGSLCMAHFKKICKNVHINTIFGELSPVDTNDVTDSEHRPRLLHFYKKHGFHIKLNEAGVGNIKFSFEKGDT